MKEGNAMQPCETFTVGNKIVNIYQDTDPLDPRKEYDYHMGTMVCFHNRHRLGDKHRMQSNAFDGWADMRRYIESKHGENAVVCLPIYMYDHSGITIRTSPFNDPWDSGQIGFIFTTKAKIRENYGKPRVTKAIIESATAELEAEVEEYDRYLTGEVYGYMITDTDYAEDGPEEVVWGFYGVEYVREAARSAACSEE